MASSAGIYKRILSLLEKWPVDQSKAGGRDFNEYLTNFVNTAYKENKFETNHKYWDNQYLALQKLINNNHKNKYRRSLNTSATGLSAEECNLVLSNKSLEELNVQKKSFFQSLISLK
ncbi:unnamed protein product [Phyllotreta striolata]|uniref:Mitochondrial nucleoid factor 1 n=1 Tax=Phyllotreta striolata TaxID=444603 RepID=A0A9N9TG78_PHYSR|nr:unnamed protein product [Phyllotreta striolata]